MLSFVLLDKLISSLLQAVMLKFVGNIKRLSKPEDLHEIISPDSDVLPTVRPILLDKGFNEFLKNLYPQSIPIANPGIFLFLPYLNKLKIFEKTSTLMDLDPNTGIAGSHYSF